MATLTSRCGNDQSSSHDHYDGLEELHCDEGVKCWAEPMSCWSSGDVASSGELVRMWSVRPVAFVGPWFTHRLAQCSHERPAHILALSFDDFPGGASLRIDPKHVS
jgi:hypothetical protein